MKHKTYIVKQCLTYTTSGCSGRSAEASKPAASPPIAQKPAASAALPVLFKPGQPPAAAKSTYKGVTESESASYHMSVDAYAQQLRDQHLKLKQAAVKAENELDRLKGLLQREQSLQVLDPTATQAYILVHADLAEEHNSSQPHALGNALGNKAAC